MLQNYYSRGTYVHNLVKWPEHESDHKPLYRVIHKSVKHFKKGSIMK